MQSVASPNISAELRRRFDTAKNVLVLTGAGVSAESGVPTFRGVDGLWRQHRATDLATPEAFARDPALVWEWYQWRRARIADCHPNAAHRVLADWSRQRGWRVITQNVDDLHLRAGTRDLIRLHGSIWELSCWAGCERSPRTWRDERALLPEEFAAVANSVDKVRRASGAARIVARELMAKLGHARQAVPKSASGAPLWPPGLVGSLAHDSRVAVAALARRDDFAGLGIDVEPAEPLDAELLNIVATENELKRIADDPYRGRLLFAVKEAVYKLTYPLDRTFLEHHDVEVDLAAGTATTRTGRSVRFRYGISAHIVALAFI